MSEFRTKGEYGRHWRWVGLTLTVFFVTAWVWVGHAVTPLATYQLGAGATTFGIALPQGQATGGIQVGTLATQTDVKNRWSDGSIKFAVVSAKVPALGSYPLTATSASSGSFTPTWPTIVVSMVINGVTWTASPGAYTGADSWLSGPVVNESRVKVAPTDGSTLHSKLEVVFDIRSYAGGGHRIDFTVQNVKDSTAMDKVQLSSASVTVNGSTLWSHGAVTSYSMTRWRHVAWSGATESTITPDLEPTFRSKAVARVLRTVFNRTYDMSGANYDIMGGPPPGNYPAFAYGVMMPDMNAGGGRPEIGAFIEHEAVYLVHKTANQRAALLRNADLMGAWSNHLTKPNGTIIKLGDPGYAAGTWWWDIRGGVGNRPLAALNPNTNFQGAREGASTDTDTGTVGMPSRYDKEHVPAPMFIAYLLTGDRYYIDEGKFWSTCAILSAAPGWMAYDTVNFPGWKAGRDGATGNERILDDGVMSRAFAWTVRLVGYTTWMIPDADPDRAYFQTTVQNNLQHAGDYLDTWVRLNYGGALGAIGGAENPSWVRTRNGVVTGRYTATWQIAYAAYVVDWCTRQGIWNITPSMDAYVSRIANLHVLMNVQNPEFLTGKAGLSSQYYPVFNTMSGGRFTKWFDTFAELKTYNETYLYEDDPAVGNTGGWNKAAPASGYYNVEHHMMLQIALRKGLPNAQLAVNNLAQIQASVNDINQRAQFAVYYYDGVSTPPSTVTNVHIK